MVTTFLSELRQAVDHHHRRRVAAMFQYPVTVFTSGLRIPVRDPESLIQMYDLFFTPEVRCLIDQSGFARSGDTLPKYLIQTAGDGMSLGGALWVQRSGAQFKIVRMNLPASSAPSRSVRHAPRRVLFFDPRYPAQFSGTLIREEQESYVVSARKGQILQARIDGFPHRDAIMHIVNQRSGTFVDARARDGTRTWTGVVPETTDYRINVVRLAAYCDPPLTYVLAVTLR